MADDDRTPLQIARFRQTPALPREVWQGGITRLPAWVQGEGDRDAFRPSGVIWVSLSTGRMSVNVESERDAHGPELVLAGLLDFARQEKKGLGGRASRLQVADAATREYLERALADEATHVEIVPRLDAVTDTLREYTKLVASDGPPSMLDGRGVTPDLIESFADAAARYYQAAPWQYLSDEDLIDIESPGAPNGYGYALVLGNAGHTFGLAFYSSREQHEAMMDASGPEAMREVMGVARSILFDRADGIPIQDHDLWMEHDLPLAGPRAYPFPAHYHKGETTRPNRVELEFAEAILRALAASTEDEVDSGRWTRVVGAGGRSTQVRLSLPGLLEPGEPGAQVGAHAQQRAAERLQAEISRFLDAHAFASEDEANAALSKHFASQPLDAMPSTASTPLERAQDLAYQAYEWIGRKRVVLAKQALALSPECAEAYIILAESAPTPERALALYEEAVAAGRRVIGDRFDGLAGELWGYLDARPYMRARMELALTLERLGRPDDAIAHFQELLRLNVSDNQGVRDLLVPRLLERGRHAEAAAVLESYPDDIGATRAYCAALLAFRTLGDTEPARTALSAAFELNRFVPALLLDPPDQDTVDHYQMGSEDEAIVSVREMGEAWRATPGALDWLNDREKAARADRRAAARQRAKRDTKRRRR